MLQVLDWDKRLPGDIILFRGCNIISKWIIKAELRLSRKPKNGFVPSHAAIVGFGDKVIEASMEKHRDSAAAVNSVHLYDGAMEKGNLQLWRIPDISEAQVAKALGSFTHDWNPRPYAWRNLWGFTREALRGLSENPVDQGNTCAQSVTTFLRYCDLIMFPSSTLTWLDLVEIRNVWPLQLAEMIWSHETKAQD